MDVWGADTAGGDVADVCRVGGVFCVTGEYDGGWAENSAEASPGKTGGAMILTLPSNGFGNRDWAFF
jgi:hypothetical protein